MKTWLVTGCSGGLGYHLAQTVIAHGDSIVVTARHPDVLEPLRHLAPERVRVAQLDVTRSETVTAALNVAVEAFGGLDILVNNAGFGFMGAIEEATPDEYRPMFETNVFGLIEVTRAALPLLRRRKGARIVNLSSGAGIAGAAGYGYYNATKFAVEGLSEALAQELASLGVKVVIVEPGPFRTDFLGRSISVAKTQIEAYAGTAGKLRDYRAANDGQQAGDPAKAARVIVSVVLSDDPPLHLPLGPVAHRIARTKLATFAFDIDAWEAVSLATNFDE